MSRTSRLLLTAIGFCVASSLFATAASANTLCVNPTGSGGCSASIQAAVDLAASGDTIAIAAGTYFENLTISASVTLNGAGANLTIIDGSGVNRVLTINGNPAMVLNISNLTVQNGHAWRHGGGIANGDWDTGALGATLTISNSVITNNYSGFGGGGGSNQVAGGVLSMASFTLLNSTVSNNRSDGDEGGLALFGGTAYIANSTISGNSSGHTECCGFGGGIGSGVPLTIVNSTISGNNSYVGMGGGIANGGPLTISFSTIVNNGGSAGGAIFNYYGPPISVKNSLIGDSAWGPDCDNAASIVSLGGNFGTSGACGFATTSLNLGPLQVNAPGTTATHALLAPSAVIDGAADCLDAVGAAVGADQRGTTRPQGAQCDSGAFEVYVPPTIAGVTTQITSLTSVIGSGNVTSLTSALSSAQASITRGNTTAAANQLNSFINKVNALARSGRLDPATSSALIGAAHQLIAQL